MAQDTESIAASNDRTRFASSPTVGPRCLSGRRDRSGDKRWQARTLGLAVEPDRHQRVQPHDPEGHARGTTGAAPSCGMGT